MSSNEKQISRLSRTYDEYRNDLIALSKKYYPELADSFNDSSVGAWFIDLVSAIGDNLSYHTDRVGQENDVNTMSTQSCVKNLARMNGLKIPGPKASMCEVQVSCVLPIDGSTPANISNPDFRYAPVLKRGSIVSSGKYTFELVEDVDFANQFNEDGFSNRIYTPKRDSNGNITGYTVSKTTVVRGGTTKIYKKIINENELKPFMEIILPEKDIMNVESIIMKESSNMTNNPSTYEYYVNQEVYTVNDVITHRFFEVDSLIQQEVFIPEVKIEDNTNKIVDIVEMNPGFDEDGNFVYDKEYPFYHIYKGKWTPITHKFITEYTDNGYLKIIFGASNKYDEIPENVTTYGEYMMSNLINNDRLGLIPKAGTTMYVLYRVGGGEETNIAQGAINSISFADVEFNDAAATDDTLKSTIVSSMSVTNLSVAMGGKDAPSTEEIKYLTKYNTSAQDRCVTVKDYQSRVMMMPPEYGSPFRCACIEDNNKILMSLLGIDANGNLSKQLPNVLTENIVEYLSRYRTVNDYVEITSGKIYNIKIEVDVFIDKNYDTTSVVKNIINTIADYFDVNKHELGEDIFVGDLQKEINMLDGVINLIEIRIYSLYNGEYNDKCILPEKSQSDDICNPTYNTDTSANNVDSYEIDLKAIDNVLYGDYNAMFEIKKPNSNIVVRCKLR